jgi:hypothetical protein
MSDVVNAPNTPPPAPAPASQQAEVPVNPNPVSTPAPIGSQAPDKAPGEAPSRREAIQKAFAKSRAENPPQPRRAKIGDNQPPEPIDREKPTIDLKKRPDDQPSQASQAGQARQAGQQRAEHGHFAPREKSLDPSANQQGVQTKHPQLPANAPYREPPQRMHERAKADWAATPESVRGDIYRAQGEFQKAYQTYKGDIEVMNTIRPFHEMARQQNTTLERALNNYVSMENKLRQDPVAGLDTIVYNLNLRTDAGQRITLRDIAWHVLNQTPEQQELLKNQNKVDAQAQQIGQLHQTVNKLVNGIQQMQYQQTFAQTRAQLDRYADAKPRFDELSDLIEREIKLGFTLDQAYARADLLRPATQAAQTRTPTAQTRTAAKSISGAPAGPSNGVARRDKPVGRREAILGAIKGANGSL